MLELQRDKPLSVVGKVYAGVLNVRVKLIAVEKVMDEQGGFKAGVFTPSGLEQ